MSITVSRRKRSRALSVLLVISGIVNTAAALSGTSVLVIYFKVPEAVLPVWLLGQVLLLCGIINIGLLIGIVISLKKAFGTDDI
mgnify:CR=1 FL=1